MEGTGGDRTGGQGRGCLGLCHLPTLSGGRRLSEEPVHRGILGYKIISDSVPVVWQSGGLAQGAGQWLGNPAMSVLSPLCPGDSSEAHVHKHIVYARHFP